MLMKRLQRQGSCGLSIVEFIQRAEQQSFLKWKRCRSYIHVSTIVAQVSLSGALPAGVNFLLISMLLTLSLLKEVQYVYVHK